MPDRDTLTLEPPPVTPPPTVDPPESESPVPETIEHAFSAHLDAIYNYCYRRTTSWSVAEDLAATVFLEAWRSRGRAHPVDGSLLPWLYGIASNVCRHHLRSSIRGARAVRRLRAAHDVATVDPADDVATHDWLLRALQRLPERDQDAFVLVCWQDLTYQQAATALSVPVGTIRSRVHRARRHLQALHPAKETRS
ncbi:RNA polymerase sigma factor [Microlunatus sp. Y2014]|uniref:RNA polymerase sigma factor n=1 Tax=Microlunatus sp. Y2014 TaxID=3418488 RepID=UPI003DA71D06